MAIMPWQLSKPEKSKPESVLVNASRLRSWNLRTTNHKQKTRLSQLRYQLELQSNNFLASLPHRLFKSVSSDSCQQKASNHLQFARLIRHFSCVRLFVTPWTVAHQASLSMGFSRKEYWSGLPFPSPGNLLDPGIEPWSPAFQEDSSPS